MKIQIIAVIALLIGIGLGIVIGTHAQTSRLQHEAVREKAGMWTNSESGAAEFKWKVCLTPQGLMKEAK